MLLGNPAIEAQGAVRVQIGHSFANESRPSFIMIPEQGFSVAVGSPYDIVFYDNRYYIFQDGSWYRSSNYQGPWKYIRTKNLPSRIRRHRLDDIRRYRDTEYNRQSHGNIMMDQQRSDENNRRLLDQQRSDENNRRTLDQQRSDENNRRTLDQQRSDENNRRLLDQQRSDENNKRLLDQKRSDENRK
jgi:hypothetical protein